MHVCTYVCKYHMCGFMFKGLASSSKTLEHPMDITANVITTPDLVDH
jgi:hypothetical protein